eukprot:4794144-Amphidinium_carterae.1
MDRNAQEHERMQNWCQKTQRRGAGTVLARLQTVVDGLGKHTNRTTVASALEQFYHLGKLFVTSTQQTTSKMCAALIKRVLRVT